MPRRTNKVIYNLDNTHFQISREKNCEKKIDHSIMSTNDVNIHLPVARRSQYWSSTATPPTSKISQYHNIGHPSYHAAHHHNNPITYYVIQYLNINIAFPASHHQDQPPEVTKMMFFGSSELLIAVDRYVMLYSNRQLL